MFTLSNFYRSREWESFRRVVIAERTEPDGFVRCAHCGEPIVKKYDLIVHHLTELTEGNVNDYGVSLNPDNCVCVHFGCHNKIHERFQGGDGWKPRPKKVFLVYGAPCSGKTTWVHDVKGRGDLVVDMDDVWQCVSGGERYDKPHGLKPVAFAVWDCLLDQVKYRNGKWANAYVITGGAMKGDRERMMQRVGADEAVLVESTREECHMKLAGRREQFSGAVSLDEWGEYIDEWFDRFQP